MLQNIGRPGELGSRLSQLQSTSFQPGGFWRRLVALLIDTFLMSLVLMPFTIIFTFLQGYFLIHNQHELVLLSYLLSVVTSMGFTFIYYYYFLTKKGATLGKQILGLKVVDNETGTYLDGKQVFMREIIGKIASAITLCIGFIMIPFRRDKRGLHDFIGGTRVIRG